MLKNRIRQTLIRLSVSIATMAVGHPVSATAQEHAYPWCTQGDTLHCYYENRAQCEETADYRGFCVANPDYRKDKTP
jgi:Protein of unknown function (DUF3551)